MKSGGGDASPPSPTDRRPCVPVLYLITQDLVNKLSNCESTYPERIDDVRDEIKNKIDKGD